MALTFKNAEKVQTQRSNLFYLPKKYGCRPRIQIKLTFPSVYFFTQLKT